ncbi:hypothetical protein [uncultured Brevundimonas sp.]|uniref:hypothetical protein n=1 Tax=uncultured Brevundimonas sp. TaxID=213418 RepID=UPI00262CA945|nr:hypothetical protein [uncultured Brevundimonas sp.]
MPRPVLRLIGNLLIAGGVAGAGALGIGVAWAAIGGGDLPAHGWIALLLGVFGAVFLAWGLMSLAFKSDREGWDDRVDNRFDPGAGDDHEP